MNRLVIVIVAVLAFACQRSATLEEEHGHPHEPEGATLGYTLYSDTTELFVEFKPLIVGQQMRLAAHFTRLGDTFEPLDEGKVTLSLIVGEKGIRTVAEKASSPGIFNLSVKPTTAGTGQLVFDIETANYKDRIVIDPVTVYADQKAAEAVAPEDAPAGEIPFSKEQAWNIDFANQEMRPQLFYNVIKVAGQLSAKPADEQIVSARSNGIVTWNDSVVPGAQVKQGQQLFVLASGGLAQGNVESQYREARANFEKAEADLERVEPLRADNIISEKDFLQIKNTYDQARIAYETLNRNYSRGGQSVQSPITGFVKQITALSGEFVQAGQALAVITKDRSLQLRAEVPLRYANELPLISEAQFRTLHNDKVHNTTELNGRVLSYGKAVGDVSPLLPIYFSIQNNGKLIPGEAVEVFLRSSPVRNAFVVPLQALIEEQGNFYVYVQTGGESFGKRNVEVGARDGKSVQLVSGVAEGERVVTKGAYMIKLAAQSGSVPGHGHEH